MKCFSQRVYGAPKTADYTHMHLAVGWTKRCVGENVRLKITNGSSSSSSS